MDNDLMARRLRPPSEPVQTAPSPTPFTLPEYEDEQDARTFHAWPAALPMQGEELVPLHDLESAPSLEAVADELVVSSELYQLHEVQRADVAPLLNEVFDEDDVLALYATPAGALDTPAEDEALSAHTLMADTPTEDGSADEPVAVYETSAKDEAVAAFEVSPWSTQAREEVPWDRPSDYEQPTDTASPDQHSWDRPAPQLWADPDAVDQTAEIFGSDAAADRPEMPYWGDAPAGQTAAVASTPRVEEMSATPATASDPDDAFAPVLGDVSAPASRAWPEMNGHDAGRNDATVVAGEMALAAELVHAPMEAVADRDERAGAAPSWPQPAQADNGWTPEATPSEWVVADLEPTESEASEPDTSPDLAPAAYADPSHKHVASEPESASEPALPATVAPDPVVAAPQPLVVRIELAIVDDSRLVAGPSVATWRVNDVNAVVLEVGQSDLASEVERLTPRHPAFDPRGTNGDEDDRPPSTDPLATAAMPAETAWLEPDLSAPSADHSFPAPTLDPPPWLDPMAPAGPELQPAPWDNSPDASASVSRASFGLASVPPESPLPPPWANAPEPERSQSAHWPPDDLSPRPDPLAALPAAPAPAASDYASQFAPPGPYALPDSPASRLASGQSAFAPAVYVERELTQRATLPTTASAQAPAVAAHEQSDLWFLATEPADVDAAGEAQVAVAKDSSILTAGLTILFAILVIVLVLVFIELMTSLLR